MKSKLEEFNKKILDLLIAKREAFLLSRIELRYIGELFNSQNREMTNDIPQI